MPQLAVIFDWDGVVVDSSRLHERAWERFAAEQGLHLPEDHFKRGFGMRNQTIIKDMLAWADKDADVQRMADQKEALFRELAREDGLDILPGARALLQDLQDNGVPCAVASSTPLENLDCAIGLLGLESPFQAVIAAEHVSQGKPHPEVFLKAAQALGYEPGRAVVIEDAHVGIRAARAAKMTVVAVATTHPAEALGEADLVVASLEAVDFTRLAALNDGA